MIGLLKLNFTEIIFKSIQYRKKESSVTFINIANERSIWNSSNCHGKKVNFFCTVWVYHSVHSAKPCSLSIIHSWSYLKLISRQQIFSPIIYKTESTHSGLKLWNPPFKPVRLVIRLWRDHYNTIIFLFRHPMNWPVCLGLLSCCGARQMAWNLTLKKFYV